MKCYVESELGADINEVLISKLAPPQQESESHNYINWKGNRQTKT